MKIKKLILITFFIAIMFSVIGITSVNAGVLDSGDTYSYYADRHRNGAYVPYQQGDTEPLVFHVSGLIGTSIEPDVNVNSEATGSAIITEISRDNILAKVAYYWGVSQGYATVSNLDSENYKFLVRANQYAVDETKATTAMNADGWSSENIQRVQSMVQEAQSVTVPDTFTAYRGEPTDNSQKFVIWETGSFFASKEYNCDTPSGFNHTIVKDGETIIYDIVWNRGDDSGETVTINDTISKGLTYVAGSSNMSDPTITKNSNGTTTLTWTTTERTGTLTYSVKVSADEPCSMGISKVANNASITVGNTKYELSGLENPLPSKCYAPKPNDGYNGQKVKVGDDIKYQITLANVKNETVTATVTDIISRGLTYNKDASVNTGKITAITDNKVDDKGNTTIQFTITIPAKSTVVLSYSAKVNAQAAVKVLNNANIRYDGERSVTLKQLENPVYVASDSTTPDDSSEEEPGTVIPAPDTGSNVLVLGVASGIALVGVGGYFIYKKMKKK